MKSIAQEDYNKTAAKNVANIMTSSFDNHLPDLEELCKTALSIGGILLLYYYIIILLLSFENLKRILFLIIIILFTIVVTF